MVPGPRYHAAKNPPKEYQHDKPVQIRDTTHRKTRDDFFTHIQGDLVRESGVVLLHHPQEDWSPSVDLFAPHRTWVIWLAGPDTILYGKITWESFSRYLASQDP